MKISWLLLLAALSLAGPSAEAQELGDMHTSFIGRAQKQEALPNVSCGDAQRICMDAYFRWTILVEQPLSGSSLPKVVRAAMLQHAEFLMAHKQSALFVLTRILDPQKRKLFGADYYIKEYSPPQSIYCVQDKSASYGLDQGPGVSATTMPGCYWISGR